MNVLSLEKFLIKNSDEGVKNLHEEVYLYDPLKNLKGKVTYQQGVKEGPAVFYTPSQKPTLECFFKKDILEGSFVVYHPNGHKQCEGNFAQGLLHGPLKQYDEFGDLIYEGVYEKGLLEGLSTAYHPKNLGGGPSRMTHYHRGSPVGEELSYHPNGVIAERRLYNDQGTPLYYPQKFDEKGREIL